MTTTTPLPSLRPVLAPPRPSSPCRPQVCAAAPLAGDAIKDRDALGFLADLAPAERAPWLDWAQRLRRADELAETDLVAFSALRAAWETSRDFGPPGDQRVADAWSRYLAALADYHRPGLVIRTLAEHDEMLLRLSGPLLQLAPGMPEELWEAAAHFGALDQFHNNLRDLEEDRRRGMCWLPEEALERYDITREDVISGRAPGMRGWFAALRWWIGTRGAILHEQSDAFLHAPASSISTGLHEMRKWTVWRYERIRRTLRAVDYDYRQFPELYWAEAQRELGESEGAST